jgi:arylsulfatase A-like enzyme
MDLAIDWLKQPAADKAPFFVQVCFGSPHSPHQAAEEFKALYADLPEKQRDFYGEISGVDAAVGRLRKALRDLGAADDTFLWFCSDNGGITPLSLDPTGKGKMSIGNRTAAVLEWPGRIRSPLRTAVPAVHMDVYPTVLDIVGVTMPNQPVLDGTSLLPLLEGKATARTKPLGFLLRQGPGNADGQVKKKGGDGGGLDRTDFVKHTQGVWIDGRLKLIVGPAKEDGSPGPARLYDIYDDPAHQSDLAEKRPEDVTRMRTALDAWRQDVRASYDGRDFAEKK